MVNIGMVRLDVFHGLLQALPPCQPAAFIKGDIGLVGNRHFRRGIDNRLIEFEYRVFRIKQVLRDFRNVGIQSDAEKRLFLLNLFKKLGKIHGGILF